jgi:8-oxo-dGTP pyrophosphatase MutT (NUDIX family)
MSKNLVQCNNCGKQGHLFHQCKLPIISYGIIVFRKYEEKYEYLMLRRKHSFGYIDFIRGKYSPYNIFQLQNIINEMSNLEKQTILETPFEELWKNMWNGTPNLNIFKSEENTSLKKMDTIKNGITINDTTISIKDIIENSPTNWEDTEWEFPKGRRNSKEKDLECALREFEEETGISKSKINIIENVVPFEEIYIGTNHKSYKHKYFLAFTNETDISLNNFQDTEVSKLEWKTVDQCLKSIRPYNLEKINLITNINKVLKEYSLYS